MNDEIKGIAVESGFVQITGAEFRAIVSTNPWVTENIFQTLSEHFGTEALYFQRNDERSHTVILCAVQAVSGTNKVKTIGLVVHPPVINMYVDSLRGDMPAVLLESTSLRPY